jgi:hypothetical protein
MRHTQVFCQFCTLATKDHAFHLTSEIEIEGVYSGANGEDVAVFYCPEQDPDDNEPQNGIVTACAAYDVPRKPFQRAPIKFS